MKYGWINIRSLDLEESSFKHVESWEFRSSFLSFRHILIQRDPVLFKILLIVALRPAIQQCHDVSKCILHAAFPLKLLFTLV